jgi:ribonuclease-3
LYKLALRHRSVAKKTLNGLRLSNERLEYLGDAVLSSIVADFLFKRFPYKDEGFLTEIRSRIVSRSQLNKLGQKLGINKLILSNTESKNQCKSMSGDAFEAFIGALYIDRGYNFTRKIIINRIINIHLDIDDLVQQDANYKSLIIEWSQKEKKTVDFNVIDEIGEGFKKQYLIEVCINNEKIAKAQDYSIKGAEKLAAEKAYAIIVTQSN